MLLLALTAAYVGTVIEVPVMLKKRSVIEKKTAREIVHAFAGLSVLTIPFFNSLAFPLGLAVTGTVGTFFSRPRSKVRPLSDLYDAIGEEGEDKVGYLQGPFYYALVITLIVAFFAAVAPDRLGLAITATLLMMVADPVASAVGRRWGKIKWPFAWTGTPRTILGSAAFLVSAFVVSWAYLAAEPLHLASEWHPLTTEIFLYASTAAVTGTVIEAVSPSNLDDITVPIGAAGAMVLVGVI